MQHHLTSPRAFIVIKIPDVQRAPTIIYLTLGSSSIHKCMVMFNERVNTIG